MNNRKTIVAAMLLLSTNFLMDEVHFRKAAKYEKRIMGQGGVNLALWFIVGKKVAVYVVVMQRKNCFSVF